MKKRLFNHISHILLIISIMLPAVINAADNRHTVVIDAGHGGHDVGAADNNAYEKDINLKVANKLAANIKKKLKDVDVVMTRDNDKFLSLQERASLANSAKGDLFISIHTNSVDKSNPNRKTVEGASVYVLGLQKDQDNMRVARRENSVIELEDDYEGKYKGFDPSSDASYIIFEMQQKGNLNKSFKFANEAQKQLVSKAGRKNRGVKQAGFWVLWATYMPAVLVELDFICNPTQAEYLISDEGSQQLADALYEAVANYFNQNAGEYVPTLPGSGIPSAVDSNDDNTQTAKTAENNKTNVSVLPSTSSSSKEKRRRRNERSKELSDSRNLEATVMPRTVKPAVQPETTVEQPARTAPESKDKTKAKTDKDNHRRNKNSYKAKKEHLTTVYKIQILVSQDQLKTNDPRFKGLNPISSFRENNLYKYTYGESTDRKEIEQLLKDVKKKISDAFIISTKK